MQSVTEGRRLIQLGGPRPAQKISEKSQNSSEKDSMYYILLPDAVQPQLASTKKKGELASRPRQKEVLYVTKDRPCWMNVTGIFLFSFNTNVYSSSSYCCKYHFAGKIETCSKKMLLQRIKTKGINKACCCCRREDGKVSVVDFLFSSLAVVIVQYLDWMLYTPVLYIYEGINPLISRVSSFSVSMTTYR